MNCFSDKQTARGIKHATDSCANEFCGIAMLGIKGQFVLRKLAEK